MFIQKQQHYTPLDEKELKEVQKALKGSPLMVRVISQLRDQEHYLELQRVHRNIINRDVVDVLRDIADDFETMRDELEDLKRYIND